MCVIWVSLQASGHVSVCRSERVRERTREKPKGMATWLGRAVFSGLSSLLSYTSGFSSEGCLEA